MARVARCPLIIRDPRVLLEQLEEKYSQQNEVAFFVSCVEGGLEGFERDLVEGPMARRGYLLDIGCGAGREALAFSRLGYRVKAIDLSWAMLDRAKASARREALPVEFEKMSVTDLRLEETFDYALFSSGVYNSIPTRALRVSCLSRVVRSVKPGGKVFVAVAPVGRSRISRGFAADCLRRLLRALFGEAAAMEPGDVLLRRISPASDGRLGVFHHFFYGTREIENELSQCGFPVDCLWPGMWQVTRP